MAGRKKDLSFTEADFIVADQIELTKLLTAAPPERFKRSLLMLLERRKLSHNQYGVLLDAVINMPEVKS